MHHTQTFSPVVLNVPRPGATLDVNQNTRSRSLQVYGNKRTEVPLSILIRVEVPWEPGEGQVADRANVFLVCWSLTLARYPHHVTVVRIIGGQVLDVRLQVGGHV